MAGILIRKTKMEVNIILKILVRKKAKVKKEFKSLLKFLFSKVYLEVIAKEVKKI
jgi:hypothetical protein